MISFLLVTCCLDESRKNVLREVINNLSSYVSIEKFVDNLTVFDNASTLPIHDWLTSSFKHVYVADKNVGYWSAIDWWLNSIVSRSDSKYTYIIESDMIHYGLEKIWRAAEYLENHDDVGSVRLHEYSVKSRHLYNKDKPIAGSKKNLWQSHTNKITGQKIEFEQITDDIWNTTFLTQLPALNRVPTMIEVFQSLKQKREFTELDFQRLYWEKFQKTAILDGGIFHCDLNPYGSNVITGSWTSTEKLANLGYKPTRVAKFVQKGDYNVTKLL